MDIEQISLFHRDVSTFRLENIEDITIETHGLLATTLGWGTLIVQTAGERRVLKMTLMPNPERVKQTMLECQEKCRAENQRSLPNS